MSPEKSINLPLLLAITIITIFVIVIFSIYFVTKNLEKKNKVENEIKLQRRNEYITNQTNEFISMIKLFIEESIEEIENYDINNSKESIGVIKQRIKNKLNSILLSNNYREITTMNNFEQVDELLVDLSKANATNWKSKFQKE